MRGTQCLRLRPLRGGCWSVAAGVQALEPLACSSSGRGMVQEACSGQQQPCTSGSGGQVPAAAAAAARGWGRHLPQRRHFVTVPTARGSATEDFDLIAPDMGLVRIEGLDDTGFIVNDVQVEGSVMVSGDVFTLWKVRSVDDISLDSLSMLQLLKPVPDLLVVGCGRSVCQLPPELTRQLHQMGVRVDAMDTANAVATFNVLNQEGRKVVGALLPQGTVEGGADGGGSGDDS